LKHPKLKINLQLKLEKLRLEVGAGPLMLEVIAVMEASVCVAEAELEVEFEVEVTVAFVDVVSPPFFPDVCDGAAAEASVVVVVDCPSRLWRWIAHPSAKTRLIQKQSKNKTRILDRIADIIVTIELPRHRGLADGILMLKKLETDRSFLQSTVTSVGGIGAVPAGVAFSQNRFEASSEWRRSSNRDKFGARTRREVKTAGESFG
jgi:hypothetical protein